MNPQYAHVQSTQRRSSPRSQTPGMLYGAGLALLLCSLAACGGGHADDAPPTASPEQAFAARAATSSTPSDRLRALSATAPRAATAAPITAVQLFLWAQATYPELFPDSPPLSTVNHMGRSYTVRAYVNGNYLGVSEGQVYGLGPFTNGALESFGPLASFSTLVCGRLNCDSSRYAKGLVDSVATVGMPTPATIKHTAVPGRAMDHVFFGGEISGDPSGVANDTIYLAMEDPLGLFASPYSMRIFPRTSGWGYAFSLTTRTLERVGRFADKLTLYACLDAQCTKRLAGTPITIPFDITVTPGVMLSRNRVEVSVPFGTTPADHFIDAPRGPLVVSTPYLSTYWESYEMEEYFSLDIVDEAGKVESRGYGERIRVRFMPRPVGSYRGKATVLAEVKLPGSSPEQWASHLEQIEIVYTVTPVQGAAKARDGELGLGSGPRRSSGGAASAP